MQGSGGKLVLPPVTLSSPSEEHSSPVLHLRGCAEVSFEAKRLYIVLDKERGMCTGAYMYVEAGGGGVSLQPGKKGSRFMKGHLEMQT